VASPGSAAPIARAHWKALAVAVGALMVWLLLGLANRGTTYHFAPLIVAAAGPVAARLDRETRLVRPEILVLAAGSVASAAVGLFVLWAAGALDGPVVVGGSAPAETGLAIVVGTVVGLVVGRFPGKASRAAVPPARDGHP